MADPVIPTKSDTDARIDALCFLSAVVIGAFAGGYALAALFSHLVGRGII